MSENQDVHYAQRAFVDKLGNANKESLAVVRTTTSNLWDGVGYTG